MKEDLVTRLRKMYELRGKQTSLADVIAICNEAADKIEDLENQLDSLYYEMSMRDE